MHFGLSSGDNLVLRIPNTKPSTLHKNAYNSRMIFSVSFNTGQAFFDKGKKSGSKKHFKIGKIFGASVSL